MRATADAVIDATVDEVWGFVSNAEDLDKWVTGIGHLGPVSGRLQPGAALKGEFTYAGRTKAVEYTVTEYDPPKRFGFKSVSSPQPLKWRVELEPVKDLTRVRNTVDAGAGNPVMALRFLLMWPLLRAGLRNGIKHDLERLRNALDEQNAKPETREA